jgi:hypothetical protein
MADPHQARLTLDMDPNNLSFESFYPVGLCESSRRSTIGSWAILKNMDQLVIY